MMILAMISLELSLHWVARRAYAYSLAEMPFSAPLLYSWNKSGSLRTAAEGDLSRAYAFIKDMQNISASIIHITWACASYIAPHYHLGHNYTACAGHHRLYAHTAAAHMLTLHYAHMSLTWDSIHLTYILQDSFIMILMTYFHNNNHKCTCTVYASHFLWCHRRDIRHIILKIIRWQIHSLYSFAFRPHRCATAQSIHISSAAASRLRCLYF